MSTSTGCTPAPGLHPDDLTGWTVIPGSPRDLAPPAEFAR